VAGPVVDDQEHLATDSAHDLLEEDEECLGVEHRGELMQEPRPFFESDDAKDMRGLAHPEGVYARLLTDSRPSSMERTVEPEARLVTEGDDAAALARCF
jgi:hypothetical protein